RLYPREGAHGSTKEGPAKGVLLPFASLSRLTLLTLSRLTTKAEIQHFVAGQQGYFPRQIGLEIAAQRQRGQPQAGREQQRFCMRWPASSNKKRSPRSPYLADVPSPSPARIHSNDPPRTNPEKAPSAPARHARWGSVEPGSGRRGRSGTARNPSRLSCRRPTPTGRPGSKSKPTPPSRCDAASRWTLLSVRRPRSRPRAGSPDGHQDRGMVNRQERGRGDRLFPSPALTGHGGGAPARPRGFVPGAPTRSS